MSAMSVTDDALADVRRTTFRAVLRGAAPTVDEIAAAAGRSREVVAAALDRLIGGGHAAVDPDGHVVAVGGLSLVPGRHRLRLGDRDFHTWCAIDALGIPAALEVDAVATSWCAWCGTELSIRLTGGRSEAGSSVVAWDPEMTCTNVMEEYCPEANLFCGEEHLESWRDEHDRPPGRVLSLPEVEDLGRRWWGDVT